MVKGTATQGRTQRARSEATTAALVGAGRRLFAQDGYEATSLDAVVAAANVTKGALYHHFDSKRDLFRAVFQKEEADVAQLIISAYLKREDPWEAFEAACLAFFDACLNPETQQILLLDGPVALGMETVRAIEADSSFELMKRGLERAMKADSIERRPVDPLAHLLFGAMCEGAMSVARHADQPKAASAMRAEFRRFLGALASGT